MYVLYDVEQVYFDLCYWRHFIRGLVINEAKFSVTFIYHGYLSYDLTFFEKRISSVEKVFVSEVAWERVSKTQYLSIWSCHFPLFFEILLILLRDFDILLVWATSHKWKKIPFILCMLIFAVLDFSKCLLFYFGPFAILAM